MNPSDEFRRHAAECRRIARSTREQEDKEAWSRMADRWLVCAENAERLNSHAAWHRTEGRSAVP